ncbi:MAG: IS5 family transposase, partial [Cyclobacteriaceae bacterium]
SPGERNPIEGKFGQAKNAYGLNRVRARLKQTSQSWIASIILVLNLVNLARLASSCLSFSAYARVFVINCSQIVRVLSALIVPANYNTAQRAGFSY